MNKATSALHHGLELLVSLRRFIELGQPFLQDLTILLAAPKRFVRDLQKTALLHDAVQLAARRARGHLLAGVDDLFAERLLGEVGYLPARHLLPEPLGDLRQEEDAAAVLADALQHLDDGPEVADVEDGQLEVDVAKVADAVGEALAARLAVGVLARRPHAVVEHAVGDGGARRVLVVQVLGDDLDLGALLHLVRGLHAEVH